MSNSRRATPGLTCRRSLLAGRPVEVDERAQRGDVEKLEHEGAGRPQGHQQLTSQYGIIAKQHDAW